jgi:hypothetical protein
MSPASVTLRVLNELDNALTKEMNELRKASEELMQEQDVLDASIDSPGFWLAQHKPILKMLTKRLEQDTESNLAEHTHILTGWMLVEVESRNGRVAAFQLKRTAEQNRYPS